MTDMPGEAAPDVAFAGRRILTRIVVALTLCSIIPILLLAWAVFVVAIPSLGAENTLTRGGLRFLIAFTVVGMVVGSYIIVDIGRAVARLAQMMSDEGGRAGLPERHDDVGTVMQSFARMLGTIDQRAAEINSLNTRL